MQKLFSTIRAKLIAGTLLIIIVPLAVFALVSGRLLWAFYAQELESQLRAHGRLIADASAHTLAPNTPDDPAALAELVEKWRRESDMRMTLCAQDGVIQAAPQQELVGTHISDDLQPGMQLALGGQPNSTVWKSPSYGYEDTMYVNLPVRDEGRIVGAVRVAYTVSEIQRKVSRIEGTMLTAVIAYGGIIVFCTTLLGGAIARPVERLTEQAKRLAAGDLEHEIQPTGSAEVRSLGRTLDDMRQRLQKLEFLRRRRVSDVSHEIRTPLASIRAIADTILMHGDSDPVGRERFLSRIIMQTDRLAAFASQLLDLENIESGRLSLDARELSVRSVVEAAAQTVEEPARRGGVAVDVELSEGIVVHGDEQRLTQVFVNLLENAVRYTPPGGAVQVSADARADGVCVDVRDTGCGIPGDDLQYIFERYYRVAKDRSPSSGGAGLGLCIVREIVEAHGGRVSADSRVGEGTTFHVVLPRG